MLTSICLFCQYKMKHMKSFFIGNIEIKTPVIQGGMGVGISLSGLASAVANEGGVGVISCAGLGLLYPKGKGSYPELLYLIMPIWCVLRLRKR